MKNEEWGSKGNVRDCLLEEGAVSSFIHSSFSILHFQLLVLLCLPGKNNVRNTGDGYPA